MELVIKNIGNISETSIKLDNITVIAGFNGTGKSTIAKSLYALLLSKSDIQRKVMYERIKSFNFKTRISKSLTLESYQISTVINDYMERYIYENSISNLTDDDYLFIKSTIIEELKDKKSFSEQLKDTSLVDKALITHWDILKDISNTPIEDYITRITSLTFQEIFNEQITNRNTKLDLSSIYLNKETYSHFIFVNNDIVEKTDYSFNDTNQIVFIETKHILNQLNDNNKWIPSSKLSGYYGNNIIELLSKSNKDKSNLSIEEVEKREERIKKINEIFNEVIHGKLIYDNRRFFYQDENIDNPLSILNLASGLKNFLVIKQLIDNYTLIDGSILIIDEPEINLHPEWQLIFAELLILISRDLDIKILINSHSAYFIRAIEVKMASYGMSQKGNYYLMKEDGLSRSFYAEDVTENTNLIYKELYGPLDEL